MRGMRGIGILIVITIIVNALGLFSVIWDGAPSTYSAIAKHMVVSNDWVNLVFANHPWLDKPHFPFWVTALSYKIFGINTFAYIFPGFLFYLIGAYYTFLLAKKLYSHEAGMLATLIYLSSFILLLYSINVEEEAYLLGEIMPACYYWFCYNEKNSITISYLLKGAFFTALAMMTKGIFVLVPIISGLSVMWLYELGFANTVRRVFSVKWLLALFFSFVLIFPELIALYLQFDSHPNLIVFGHTHFSGIKFFFWDSQFGRFFDTGPITMQGHHYNFWHYTYFLHVILWAFLPWSFLFIAALWKIKRNWISLNKINCVYLLGSFFPAFVMFSLTKFQVAHYINIIIPFAAIMVSYYLLHCTHDKIIWRMQSVVSLIFCSCVVFFCFAIILLWPNKAIFFDKLLLLIIAFIAFGIFIYILDFLHNRRLLVLYFVEIFVRSSCTRLYTASLSQIPPRLKSKYKGYARSLLLQFKRAAIVVSVSSVLTLFLCLLLLINIAHKTYSKSYLVGQYLKNKPAYTVIDYNAWSASMAFNLENRYMVTRSIPKIMATLSMQQSYYIVIDKTQWNTIQPTLITAYKNQYHAVPTIKVLYEFHTLPMQNLSAIFTILLNAEKRKQADTTLLILLHT